MYTHIYKKRREKKAIKFYHSLTYKCNNNKICSPPSSSFFWVLFHKITYALIIVQKIRWLGSEQLAGHTQNQPPIPMSMV
jgi:hypothetical protein